MGKEIAITNRLELNLVLDIHEKEFERQIINGYCNLILQDRVEEFVPAVFEVPYHPKFIFAPFVYMENDGDMKLVEGEMAGWATDGELSNHCIDQLSEIEEYDPQLINDYERALGEDIQSVLDFHNMVYWDVMYDGFRGRSIYYLVNHPVVPIW